MREMSEEILLLIRSVEQDVITYLSYTNSESERLPTVIAAVKYFPVLQSSHVVCLHIC